MYYGSYYEKKMTRREMQDHLQWINTLLLKAGIEKKLVISHRYDYYGLDVYDVNGVYGSMLSGPHRTGSFRQCLDHAYTMALRWISEKHFGAT